MTNLTQSDDKEALRNRLKRKRRTHQVLSQDEAALNHALIHHPRVQSAATIAGYLAMDGEINLQPFFAWAWENQKKIVVPQWHQDQYFWTEYTSISILKASRYGVRQPQADPEWSSAQAAEAVDVWVVPGLAFTHTGVRLGMGEGNYDRVLCKAKGYKIGITDPTFYLDTEIPQDPWDVSMDEVLKKMI
jgi:5-formyltetrahydrofolate cyclo-ligase